MEEGKIGKGQTLFITDPLDTWSPLAQGSSARVFRCITRHGGSVKLGAIKIMRPDRAEYALPLFHEEAKILEIMKGVDGVVSLLECGFIKSINIAPFLNTYDKKPVNINGAVRCFINDTTSFLKLLEEYTGKGWLPYLILEPLSIEQNLLALTDRYRNNHRYLPLNQAQEVLAQACLILEAAHNKHIVYRDHKILHYHWDQEDRHLKLIDWNVGKIYPEGLPDDARRTDLMEFVARTAYHILTGNSSSVLLSLSANTPKYNARWNFDDTMRISEELRTVIEMALQGQIKSAKVLGELFRDPTKLKGIAPEVLNKYQDIQDIPAYLFSGVDGKKYLNEVKTIFIGQGSVGKTSLVQQILHGTFDQNQIKTDGISINQWLLDDRQSAIDHKEASIVNGPTSIKLNIWDFGGQEIMHATHQFFLTKRSLYLLVLDARLTQEENRVEYWLKIIQSFGGESPVLIVGNKTDQHPLDIDRTGLQKKYPNIVGILETSAATGAGIEALKAAIAKQVDTLPHVRDLLPETWFTVKSKLEELGRDKNFITQDEYLNLCGANDVADETSQNTLIGFLHDLGVVLHFQDDPRLEALGILNPQWVTNGVYKILNSHELFQNQGTLTIPILNKTLIPPEYPSNKRLFIVDMMKKFELCYDIEPDKSFLIPDLLPKDEIYTGEWNDALAFQYHYNVLPSSIISRFIVRMNAFIHKNTIWRSGVVLKSGNNTALIKADTEDRKIYIWVSGEVTTRKELLAVIRAEFASIHKTIAKIEATEKVPLPDAPEADPVDLAFLQRLASEGRESLPVQVGNRIIDLIVKEVLGQIEKEGKSLPTINNFYGDVYGAVGNNNTVNFIQQKFEPIYEAIEASSRDITEKQDLAAEVDEIKNEVAKGDGANESFLSRRLRNLKKMAPDIADVALTTLANPVAGFGNIIQKIAKKIQEETK